MRKRTRLSAQSSIYRGLLYWRKRLTLFLPSILSNDRFPSLCLFTIYIFKRHDCDEIEFQFFNKKLFIVLPLIINFHFLRLDGSSSMIQTCFIAAILTINSCFCHQYLPMAIPVHHSKFEEKWYYVSKFLSPFYKFENLARNTILW